MNNPATPEPADLLLDTREAAAVTKCSVSKLKHDRVKGVGLPYSKPPGSNRVLYRYSDIMRWVESGRRNVAA